MAYAIVGSPGAVNSTAVTTANTPSYGQSPTAGNLLILTCVGGTVATFPTTPAGWTLFPSPQEAATTVGSASLFFKVAAGADAQPTITAKTGVVWFCQLYEFSGNAAVTPNDQSGINTNTTGATLVVTNGGTDATGGELVFGVAFIRYAVAATKTLTDTFNNGATATSANNNAAAVVNHYSFSYGVTTGNAGADTYTNTRTTTSLSAAASVFASFKAAATSTTQVMIVQ